MGNFSVLSPRRSGKSGPPVYDILADREGVLVAADNGLWRYPWRRHAVGRPRRRPASPADNFRALAVTAEGLWLGTYSHGVWRRNDSGWEAAPAGTAAARSDYQMSVQPSGTLYISTLATAFSSSARDRQ